MVHLETYSTRGYIFQLQYFFFTNLGKLLSERSRKKKQIIML